MERLPYQPSFLAVRDPEVNRALYEMYQAIAIAVNQISDSGEQVRRTGIQAMAYYPRTGAQGRPGALDAHGDTGVPPEPGNFAAESYERDGVLRISALGFAGTANLHSVSAGTLFIRYFNEIAGVQKVLFWPIIDDHTDPITFYPAGGVTGLDIGDDLAIDSEDMRITAKDPGAGTVTCTRAQLGSSMAEHLIGADIYRLDGLVAISPFPPGFFDDIGEPRAPIGSWKYDVNLPCGRVASIQFSLTNVFGDGPAKTQDYLGLCSDPYPVIDGRQGLRTNRGGSVRFVFDGLPVTIAAPSDDVKITQAVSLRDVFAWVEGAPVGDILTAVLTRNGDDFVTLVIAAGETLSDCLSGASLATLQADDVLNWRVVVGGSATYPGLDLRLEVRF